MFNTNQTWARGCSSLDSSLLQGIGALLSRSKPPHLLYSNSHRRWGCPKSQTSPHKELCAPWERGQRCPRKNPQHIPGQNNHFPPQAALLPQQPSLSPAGISFLCQDPGLGEGGGEGTALQNKAGIKYSQPQSGLSLSISWDRGRGSSGNFHGIGAPRHRWAQRPVPFHQENPGNLCTKREGGTGTTQGGFSIVFSKLILGVGGRDRQSSLTSVCFACWGLENRALPPTELQVLSLTSISSFSVAKHKARS